MKCVVQVLCYDIKEVKKSDNKCSKSSQTRKR